MVSVGLKPFFRPNIEFSKKETIKSTAKKKKYEKKNESTEYYLNPKMFFFFRDNF